MWRPVPANAGVGCPTRDDHTRRPPGCAVAPTKSSPTKDLSYTLSRDTHRGFVTGNDERAALCPPIAVFSPYVANAPHATPRQIRFKGDRGTRGTGSQRPHVAQMQRCIRQTALQVRGVGENLDTTGMNH